MGADRDVEVDIIANDKTDRGVDSAARKFDGLDRKVKKSSTDRTKSLEKDSKKAVTVFSSLFGELVKQGQKSGMLAAGATIDGFGSAFKALPPEVKIGVAAGLAGAAVAAAPAVVSVFNAAMLAGIGAGGLVAGIALAAKDPAVVAAYTNLGNHVKTRLQDSAKPFRKELIDSASDFEHSFDVVEPRIRRMFASLSTTVRPIAQGLAKGLENAAPGLERAVNASLPLLHDLARELPRVGQLVGELFDAIADAGPGAELTFRIILVSVEALIKTLTWLVQSLGPVANGVAALDQVAHGLAATLAGKPDGFTRSLTTLSSAAGTSTFTLNGLTVAEYNTADAARAADSAFRALFGELMSLDEATLRVQQGMLQLGQTLKSNNGTLDANTAKGQANRAAILQQIQAIEAQREAAIAAGNGTKAAVDKANAAYLAQLERLRAVAAAAGVNTAALDAMIAKYRQIPSQITTTITTVYKVVGTPSGPIELGRGQSREKFASLDGWAPANFARSGGPGGAGFAAAPGGAGRTTPPYRIDQKVDVAVLLDGEPVRRIASTVARDEDRRRAWRSRVGQR